MHLAYPTSLRHLSTLIYTIQNLEPIQRPSAGVSIPWNTIHQ